MLKKVNKIFFLFIFGFMAYVTIEVCYRNISYPLMGVCGGLAFIIIDSINNKISWDIDILLQGVIGSAVITTFEFIIGELSDLGWSCSGFICTNSKGELLEFLIF